MFVRLRANEKLRRDAPTDGYALYYLAGKNVFDLTRFVWLLLDTFRNDTIRNLSDLMEWNNAELLKLVKKHTEIGMTCYTKFIAEGINPNNVLFKINWIVLKDVYATAKEQNADYVKNG